MIFEINYKGLNAVQLENEALRAIVLPKLGGKIASIYLKNKDFELAYQCKSDCYNIPRLYSDFSCFDASGFDDAFPTIDASNVKVLGNDVMYPDHGEAWNSSFSYKIAGEFLELEFNSSILPYNYKKTITLNGNSINVSYSIKNTGSEDFPCIFAAHYLVNCEEDMILKLPENISEVMNVLESKFLGTPKKLHSYPKTKDSQGNIYDLSRIYPKSAGKYEKYYVFNKIKEGSCGIYYPQKDVNYRLYYDSNILPYLGFWVTEGGFRGDYNCALEPTNGFYDSIETAKKENKLFTLEKGKSLKFTIGIELM